MLNSNVTNNQLNEILSLVPDATKNPEEFWRIVPDTAEGLSYSVSSRRNILVKHSYISRGGRHIKPRLLVMQLDGSAYKTSIKRSSNKFSTYIEHIRLDAFPELCRPKLHDHKALPRLLYPYNGLDWYGHKITEVYILPVSDTDMAQVRMFYPQDLDREVWAYVPDTDLKYVISSQSRGVILKRYRSNGQILKATKWQLKSPGQSYFNCCVTVGDTQLNSVSHSQVLRSFIPKPGDNYEVNHIDGDHYNNVLDNLEWVTRAENSIHYNTSPQMESRRQSGFQKISEYGKLHQKEIQNRPEVNAKRSATLKATLAAKHTNLQVCQDAKDTYIYLNDVSKKISHQELDNYLKQGWRLGRYATSRENSRNARQTHVWKYDNLTFRSSYALADYLNDHGYPKIVQSTVAAIYNNKFSKNYPELVDKIDRMEVQDENFKD